MSYFCAIIYTYYFMLIYVKTMYNCLSFLFKPTLTKTSMSHPKNLYLIFSSLDSVRTTKIGDMPKESGSNQEFDSRNKAKHKTCQRRDDQDLDVENHQDYEPLRKPKNKILYQDYYCNNIIDDNMYIFNTLPFLSYNFCDPSNYTFPSFLTVNA